MNQDKRVHELLSIRKERQKAMEQNYKDLLASVTEHKNVSETETKILKTKNYDLFELSVYNRDANHYRQIVDSIKEKDLTMYNPILVEFPNDKKTMVIIDGQNRYLACKELGKPIYFIITDQSSDIHDAVKLNQASKNWNVNDYVQYYAKLDKYEYKKLLQLNKEYDISLGTLAVICSKQHRPLTQIKNGKYKINTNIDYDAFFEHHNEFHDYIPFANRRVFITALYHAFKNDGYDSKRMLDKVHKYASVVRPQHNTELFLKELENLYNYRANGRNKVNFDMRYGTNYKQTKKRGK